MITNVIGKVTCFITRKIDDKLQLLLIQHPNAGIQIPAGTVELDENFKHAAIREAIEETGIEEYHSCTLIGSQEQLFDGKYILYKPAKIYSKPDVSSIQWAEIRRGITVLHERKHKEFVQVSYIEGDQYPNPNYISYQITGWVEEANLASKVMRHFYHLQANSKLNEWAIETDQHTFKLFWAPLENLPLIVSPQDKWLAYFLKELKQ